MDLISYMLTMIVIVLTLSPVHGEEKEPFQKNHLLYLVRSEKIEAAIDAYKAYYKITGKHDSELLEQMALILLDQGMTSHDEEKELISLYGASLAGTHFLLDLCEQGMKTRHPTTQLVAIQMAGQLQEDRSIDLLCKAFSSEFLGIRMEAASYMAQKKYRHALGYIESLMNKLPPPFHCFFSEFYGQIGSTEAVTILKKMLHDPELYTRIAAILAIAHHGRDDLVKEVRNNATHLNPAEQEACALALGALGDSHSINILEKMAKSSDDQVQLAAYHALYLLGKQNYLEDIKNLAKACHLFAINYLGTIEGTSDLLFELTQHSDKQVKFNAALALLKQRDQRCLPMILELLLTRAHDIGFLPHYSQGRSNMYWKILPTAGAYAASKAGADIPAISLAVREQALLDCLELPQSSFLFIAKQLLDHQQKDLIPLLMQLLCNQHSDEAITLLKNKAEDLSSPFIRNYASLALFQLKIEGPYQQRIESWVRSQKGVEMIRFRPLTTKSSSETSFHYQLTPEESSALLVQALMHIAHDHDEKSIDLLLDVLKQGHKKNQPIIAGLLLKSLE